MKDTLAIITLTRPLNCLITFISIWIGAIVAGGRFVTYRLIIASLSGALIAAYGNIINDIFDIEVDRINKPYRPLANGTARKIPAIAFAVLLAITGFALSLLVHNYAFIVSLIAIVLLLVYTPFFKGIPYIGNLIVAFVGSLAFIYGGMSVDRPLGAWILSLFAFLLHFGREIVKDIQDRTADSRAGHRTAPIVNINAARAVAAIVFSLLIIATMVPFAAGQYHLIYLVVVIIGVDFILVEAIYRLWVTDSEDQMRQVALLLKFAMPLGLLAVLLGRLGY